jgi:transmembrane sensor
MNVQIYAEATDWVVKHRDGELGSREKKAFDAWVRESPQHVRAYLEMSAIWEDVPSLDPGWNPDAEELIARARAESNVFSVETPNADAPAREHRDMQRTPGARYFQAKVLYALAASLLIAFACGWLLFQRDVYTTGTGEQRVVTLPDGSTVELNSRSRLAVHYSQHERRIDLLQGQALFRVERNAALPFIVQTGSTQVRAVGTQFDVYRKTDDIVVTVVEGRVAVSSANAHPSMLAAGEQIIVTPASAAPVKRADAAAATAWTRRNLMFDGSPLTEVALEFNRYNTRRLLIDSPELANFHVSGIFSSVDPTLLVRFLRAQPELVVHETRSEIHVQKR